MALTDIVNFVPTKMLPDSIVRMQYANSCLAFYGLEKAMAPEARLNNGEYRHALARYAIWEREYAHRGYRTESPSTLLLWQIHGMLNALGQRRAPAEKAYLYAKRYIFVDEKKP